VRACAFSPDGSRIVTGSRDNTCKIWDTESRKELMTLRGHGGSIEACTFTPDGTLVISASNDRTLRVWDAHSGNCIGTFPLLGEGRVVAHDPGGTYWVCGDTSGAVYLTDLVGVGLGPIFVTPEDRGNGPQFRCPICHMAFPLDEAWLGKEVTCLSDTCSGRLRLNPFVIDRSRRGTWMDWI